MDYDYKKVEKWFIDNHRLKYGNDRWRPLESEVLEEIEFMKYLDKLEEDYLQKEKLVTNGDKISPSLQAIIL